MGKKKSVVKGIKESECVESYGQTENKEIEKNILKQQIKNYEIYVNTFLKNNGVITLSY